MEKRGDFRFDASLNSCTSPPTLDFTMLEPKRKTLHVKNGRNTLWDKTLDVQMKKVGSNVMINVSRYEETFFNKCSDKRLILI